MVLAGPILIIQQGLMPAHLSNIFVIDILSGTVGKLKFNADNNKPFSVNGDQLTIEGEGSRNRFSIKKITAELKNQLK